MEELVKEVGVLREVGYLYFINDSGDVIRIKMPHEENSPELVVAAGITKEEGFLYFLDKNGNIARKELTEEQKKEQMEEKRKERHENLRDSDDNEDLDLEMELKKYKDLFDEGLIDKEDYDAKKKEILGL
tara:strand:- start:84 stop:473 length:390 start_codon:yes stop_codon:yes gene_type:complete